MANPYSSTPLYTGTPSYAAQQPYYPHFQPNALQQPIHTPPGIPQQPPQQQQQQQQPHPAYQPSPATNVARFDSNSQIRPPAPAFPQFPPPATFSPDFFKQFTNAGLPPPPPPSFPPVPLPTTGYPQMPAMVNASVSSPYPQHSASTAHAFGSGFAPNEQVRQHLPDPFMSSQSGGARGGRDGMSESQSYDAPNPARSGNSHAPYTAFKNVDLGPDPALPSFGSRSDLELLFASVQQQTVPPQIEQAMGASQGNGAKSYKEPARGGNVSPYDPSRPAAIHDGSAESKPTNPKPFERVYDNKSLPELRQLAKGALLSLVPHKIMYADLLQEGVHAQVLQELYDELGLKTEVDPPKPSELHSIQQAMHDGTTFSAPLQSANSGTQVHEAAPSSSQVILEQSTDVPPSTGPSSSGAHPQSETLPPPAADMTKHQSAPSPSLERKDRIAQLLAAKTGRSNSTPSGASPGQKDERVVAAAARAPETHQPQPASASPKTQPDTLGGVTKPKSQTELVKQKMAQLKLEAQARKQAADLGSSLPGSTTLNGKPPAHYAQSAPQQGSSPLASTRVTRNTGSQPTAISAIPGLFMTATELSEFENGEESALEIAKSFAGGDTEMSGTSDAGPPVGGSLPSGSMPLAIVSRKRSYDLSAEPQPLPKKANISGSFPRRPSDADEGGSHSEGEIVEDAESDDMAIGSDSEPQDNQEDYGKSDSTVAPTAPPVNKVEASKPSSTTPLQSGLGGEAGGDELYRAKQSQIEGLRRRIAELEQQKVLKRTRSQAESPAPSALSTPAISKEGQQLSSSPAPQPSGQENAGGSSPQLQRQPLGPRTISKLTSAQLVERAANLKADLLRQRAQRQQILQNGLPDLNAEVKKTESRLQIARSELNRVRTDIERSRAELERSTKIEIDLLEEISQLEKQLQEGRTGQKQYSDELAQIKLEKLAESQATPTPEESEPIAVAQSAAQTDGQPSSPGQGSTGIEQGPRDTAFGATILPIIQQASTLPTEAFPKADPGAVNGQPVDVESEALVEATLPADHTQTDEMEISPEPEVVPQTLVTPYPTSDLGRGSNNSVEMDDGNSDGSASMSDSGSDDEEEEYEPVEEYEAADTGASQPSRDYDADSDEYDPEEAPVESVTPTTGAEDGNEDLYEPSEAVEAAEPVSFHGEAETPLEGATVSEVPADTRDDLETAPQLTEADTVIKAQPVSNGDGADDKPFLDGNSPPASHFVPYKTPLSAFKTFRFHSDFNDTVKSGYRSLTYSNNIDPTRPLCPTELSGEACTDPKCEEQHFSQLGLPDDKILVQMSSASDIKDKDVRDHFLVGLKQVIADLRAKDVKEFESVADALSRYRRHFYAEKEKMDAA